MHFKASNMPFRGQGFHESLKGELGRGKKKKWIYSIIWKATTTTAGSWGSLAFCQKAKQKESCSAFKPATLKLSLQFQYVESCSYSWVAILLETYYTEAPRGKKRVVCVGSFIVSTACPNRGIMINSKFFSENRADHQGKKIQSCR